MTTGDTRPRLPRYRRADTPPPMRLTDRDEEILQWVEELHFATQEQIQALLFTTAGASSAKRRLTLLFHNGYLTRKFIPLRGGFGASRAAYCIDQRGAALLSLRRGTGAVPDSWKSRRSRAEFFFIEHLLATHDFRIAVTLAAKREQLDLHWTSESILRNRSPREFVPDPSHPGQLLRVIPDGLFSLDGEAGRQLFAVELDRGTVEANRIRERVRAYGEWWHQRRYVARFGQHRLRVLFVVTASPRDPRRIAHLKAWTEAEGGGGLFWFAALDQLTPESVLREPIWTVAARQDLSPLLP